MRLWLALPACLFIPAGILMFGIGLSRGDHWIVLAIGYGLWGFGFVIATDISLAYCTDCYQDIVVSIQPTAPVNLPLVFYYTFSAGL